MDIRKALILLKLKFLHFQRRFRVESKWRREKESCDELKVVNFSSIDCIVDHDQVERVS